MAHDDLLAALAESRFCLRRLRLAFRYIERGMLRFTPPVPSEPASEAWPSDPRDFSLMVREKRLEARLSQRELAELAGLSQYTIKNIEIGKRLPALASIDRVVRALSRVLPEVGKPTEAD